MRSILLALLVLLVCASCRTTKNPHQPSKVLFVGNSLTYVGNVPAIYSALEAANGKVVASDMIVRAGATLTQRVADGSVARALAADEYAAVVLQERGGDLLCSFGPDSCARSRQALAHLSALGKERGAKVVLLGTYQSDPSASRRLVEEEADAAAAADIGYIEVSETLQGLHRAHPQLTWFAADGMHPGKDLSLLIGLLVYEALRGTLPPPDTLSVWAPIYGTTSGLTETLRSSGAPPPLPDTPPGIRYPSNTLEKMLVMLGARPRR